MSKQITEDYCSFEVAKLLKEKGFPQQEYINTFPYYTQNGNLWSGDINTVRQRYCVEAIAITQSFALKWLREVHKIFVEPFVSIDLNGKYHYCFRLLNSICKDILEPKDLVRIGFKDTYEQAVEAALKYVLENLI